MHAVRQMHASLHKAPIMHIFLWRWGMPSFAACQRRAAPDNRNRCEGAHPVLDRDAARLSHVQRRMRPAACP